MRRGFLAGQGIASLPTAIRSAGFAVGLGPDLNVPASKVFVLSSSEKSPEAMKRPQGLFVRRVCFFFAFGCGRCTEAMTRLQSTYRKIPQKFLKDFTGLPIERRIIKILQTAESLEKQVVRMNGKFGKAAALVMVLALAVFAGMITAAAAETETDVSSSYSYLAGREKASAVTASLKKPRL